MTGPETHGDTPDGPPVFLPEPAARPAAPQPPADTPEVSAGTPGPGRGIRLEQAPAGRRRGLPLWLVFLILAGSLYISVQERSIIPFLFGGAFFVLYFRSRRR